MRKSITYIVEDSNSRDFGKKFIITEMSAFEAELFAHEMLSYMARIHNLPDAMVDMGCHGLATYGMAALMGCSTFEYETISAKLLAGVRIAITGTDNTERERALLPEDTEEWKTLRELKDQVFKLNFDFLKRDEQ